MADGHCEEEMSAIEQFGVAAILVILALLLRVFVSIERSAYRTRARLVRRIRALDGSSKRDTEEALKKLGNGVYRDSQTEFQVDQDKKIKLRFRS